DDPFVIRNIARQHVQDGRLSGAGSSGNNHVFTGEHADLQELDHGPGDGAHLNQVLRDKGFFWKTADGDGRAIDGQGRNNGVDARAILEAGVDHRYAFVDAAAQGRDNAAHDLD